MAAQRIRNTLCDFGRFKAMVLKRKYNKLRVQHTNKALKTASGGATKKIQKKK